MKFNQPMNLVAVERCPFTVLSRTEFQIICHNIQNLGRRKGETGWLNHLSSRREAIGWSLIARDSHRISMKVVSKTLRTRWVINLSTSLSHLMQKEDLSPELQVKTTNTVSSFHQATLIHLFTGLSTPLKVLESTIKWSTLSMSLCLTQSSQIITVILKWMEPLLPKCQT